MKARQAPDRSAGTRYPGPGGTSANLVRHGAPAGLVRHGATANLVLDGLRAGLVE
ncbi:hypothetical protein [Streptomyces sp. NPDC057287]|uniref:hypothetical protein n=1 Tax=Streptomyces sp. NPDC057287 TaxID=3346086 RepID=UPI0036404DAD